MGAVLLPSIRSTPTIENGYFVSDLRRLSTGEVERRHEGHTAAIRKDSGPCGISTAIELYPHVPGLGMAAGFLISTANELEFPSAFRQCRRYGKPRGIVKSNMEVRHDSQ